jgi:hypothetical protein
MSINDKLSTWQYKTKHVQARDGAGTDFDAGNFVRGASVLLVAGPRRKPDLSNASTANDMLWPIGLLQTGSISQQKQLEEIFEIGSERRYFITGRTFYSLQAARIMVDGASLMRALYNERTHSDQTIVEENWPGTPYGTTGTDYYLNLASIFFNKPTGILMIDNNNDDVVTGAVYLEDCYIQNYNRQIVAAQTVVAEQCTVRFDGMKPCKATEVAAIIAL